MNPRAFFSVVLLTCTVVGGRAIPQQADDVKGLSHLGLLVETLDQDAQRCGITRDLIRDAIAYTISASKLTFSDDESSGPKIYVRIVTLIQRQPLQCVSSISFDVDTFQKVQLDYTDEPPRVVAIELWPDDWLEVSIPERHSQDVRRAIENATKKLVAAWYLANKP
jgi:hypothetical protein